MPVGHINDTRRTNIMIQVGQTIDLGWNGAKYFDEMLGYSEVRVEAVGVDWIVVRTPTGKAYATGFTPGANIKQELEA